MDASAEKLLRQLRQFQKSTAAYEKSRVKMIEKEQRSLGLTDTFVQRELKAIGVDVKSLLKETAAEEKELRKVHKKFFALVRPPHSAWRSHPRDSSRPECV